MALAALAFTFARLLSSGTHHEFLIWPAAAIGFAFAWRYGFGALLATAIGTTCAAAIIYQHVALASLAGLACIVGPSCGLAALRRLNEWKPAEFRLEAVLRFLVVALLVISPMDAFLATLGIGLIGASPAGPINLPLLNQSLANTWLAWWLVEALGLILITPAILSWIESNAFEPEPVAEKAPGLVDGPSIGATVLLVSLMMGLHAASNHQLANTLFFASFPIAIFLAVRRGARVTVLSLLALVLPLLATQAYFARHSLGLPQVLGRSPMDVSIMMLCVTVVGLILQSIATDRRLALTRVSRQSREDMSTGLLNDRGLLADFGDRLAMSDRSHYGLIGIHLTNFDRVNDLCGGIAALHLEQATAALLLRQPGAQTAARLSSGRYTLVAQARTVSEVRSVSREIYSQLNGQLFKTENGSLRLQACIAGLLIDKSAIISSEDCLSALGDAMSIAASVRDPQLFVEPLSQTMIDARRAHQEKIEHIREAIRDARIELYGQLILDPDAPEGRLSYEILTRLRDTQGKLIQPPEFMPLATQAQMTTALDRAVIQRIFAWLADHPSALASTHKCSINLSGLTLSDSSISAFVRQQQALFSIPVEKIVFEITESEAIRNPAAASRLVDELKEDGFGIALDDFGTGLATFEYLKRFPLDYLKIDGQFIRNLENNPIDEEIVLATIRVAKRLGVKTIAEHVHSAEIMALLKELGVDHMQGYYIGEPEPIQQLFANHRTASFAAV